MKVVSVVLYLSPMLLCYSCMAAAVPIDSPSSEFCSPMSLLPFIQFYKLKLTIDYLCVYLLMFLILNMGPRYNILQGNLKFQKGKTNILITIYSSNLGTNSSLHQNPKLICTRTTTVFN